MPRSQAERCGVGKLGVLPRMLPPRAIKAIGKDKAPAENRSFAGVLSIGPGRDRTCDLGIKSHACERASRCGKRGNCLHICVYRLQRAAPKRALFGGKSSTPSVLLGRGGRARMVPPTRGSGRGVVDQVAPQQEAARLGRLGSVERLPVDEADHFRDARSVRASTYLGRNPASLCRMRGSRPPSAASPHRRRQDSPIPARYCPVAPACAAGDRRPCRHRTQPPTC